MIKKILFLVLSFEAIAVQAANDDRVVFEPHEARIEVLYQMDHRHSHSSVSTQNPFRFDESHIVSAILGLHLTYPAKAYIDRSLGSSFLIQAGNAHHKPVESDIAFIQLTNENSIRIKEDGSVLVDLSDAMLQKIAKVNPRVYAAVRLWKKISEDDAKILWRAQEQCKLLADQHEEQHDVLQYEQQQAKEKDIFASLYDLLRGNQSL